MARVKILGSASGIPTKERFAASVYLELDGVSVLLDCGEPCSASLVRENINYNEIDPVFISHLHCDHVAGLPLLLQTMQLTSRKKPLELFVPCEAVEGLRKYLELVYLVEDVLPFTIDIKGIRDGIVWENPGIKISAFKNGHFNGFLSKLGKKFPENLGESYSFLIETGTIKIAYSGDIAAIDELSGFSEGVDLFILSRHFHGYQQLS
ncbi:Ribonuclease BN [subsurface metagenome]